MSYIGTFEYQKEVEWEKPSKTGLLVVKFLFDLNI